MRERKHRRNGAAARPEPHASPEDLGRAEAKIRAAFRLLDGPELEELRFAWEEGQLVAHLTLRHKLDLGKGPGIEDYLTERNPLGVHLDRLLAMEEAVLARVFEWEVSEGSLAPDLSCLAFSEAVMAAMSGLPQGEPRG